MFGAYSAPPASPACLFREQIQISVILLNPQYFEQNTTNNKHSPSETGAETPFPIEQSRFAAQDL